MTAQLNLTQKFKNVLVTANGFFPAEDMLVIDKISSDYERLMANLKKWEVGLEKLAAELGDNPFHTLKTVKGKYSNSYNRSFEDDDENPSYVNEHLFSTVYGQHYIKNTLAYYYEVRNRLIVKYINDKYDIEISDNFLEVFKEVKDVLAFIIRSCDGLTLTQCQLALTVKEFKRQAVYAVESVPTLKGSTMYFPKAPFSNDSSTAILKMIVSQFEFSHVLSNSLMDQYFESGAFHITRASTIIPTCTKIKGFKRFVNGKFEIHFENSLYAEEFFNTFSLDLPYTSLAR